MRDPPFHCLILSSPLLTLASLSSLTDSEMYFEYFHQWISLAGPVKSEQDCSHADDHAGKWHRELNPLERIPEEMMRERERKRGRTFAARVRS
jgi:hypothetical protein